MPFAIGVSYGVLGTTKRSSADEPATRQFTICGPSVRVRGAVPPAACGDLLAVVPVAEATSARAARPWCCSACPSGVRYQTVESRIEPWIRLQFASRSHGHNEDTRRGPVPALDVLAQPTVTPGSSAWMSYAPCPSRRPGFQKRYKPQIPFLAHHRCWRLDIVLP
jgi:hypothetical protein